MSSLGTMTQPKDSPVEAEHCRANSALCMLPAVTASVVYPCMVWWSLSEGRHGRYAECLTFLPGVTERGGIKLN